MLCLSERERRSAVELPLLVAELVQVERPLDAVIGVVHHDIAADTAFLRVRSSRSASARGAAARGTKDEVRTG